MSATARLVARRPWLGSAILTAHAQRSVPVPLAQPGLDDLERVAARPAPRSEFMASLQAAVTPEVWDRLQPCADPRALVVVTGQQPGCAGGPLLVLAKAATAVALARRAALRLGRPVVPLFWNATDDVDFDEIARVTWPGAKGELLFLELSGAGRRSQGWVGDLPAAADAAAARAAFALAGEAGRRRLEPLVPAAAADHGDWVARLLCRVFPSLAVVDARLPALRRFAAPLFGRYLDSQAAALASLAATRAALAAAGFQPALAAESLAHGLFLLHEGQRHKTKEIGVLKRALRASPEALSPNVTLRPMVQDALFPVLASVVGPAEVAYLHELAGLRAHLGVPEVALVPRLGLTLIETEELRDAAILGLDPGALVDDAERTLRGAAARRVAPRLEAARAAFGRLQSELTAVATAAGSKSVSRVLFHLQKMQQEFGASMEEAGLRELWEAAPALEGLPARLRPRGKPQERSLAALWLLARWGSECGEELVGLANLHLDSLERGTLEQLLVAT